MFILKELINGSSISIIDDFNDEGNMYMCEDYSYFVCKPFEYQLLEDIIRSKKKD